MGAGPGQRQDPGTQSGAPMWVAKTQVLTPLPIALQCTHEQEARFDNRAMVLNPDTPRVTAGSQNAISIAVPVLLEDLV